MSATKYILLYRYINDSTGIPILNDTEEDYESTLEFYTDPDHKYFSKDESEQSEAMDKLQQVISDGNSASNPKASMLFAYTGTKKIKHKKWTLTQTGYVVRDWTKLNRNEIGDNGDWTKPYTTLGATTPENGGQVVAFQKTFKRDFPVRKTILNSENQGDLSNEYGKYYSMEHLEDIIRESTLYQLNTGCNYRKHTIISEKLTFRFSKYLGYYERYSYKYIEGYKGPIGVDQGKETIFNTTKYPFQVDHYCDTYVSSSGDKIFIGEAYSSVYIDPSQVETINLDAHYEDDPGYPYLIKDEYSRIKSTPWFINSIHGSLESAIKKAKILSKAIGLDNIQIIKDVNKDTFIKIK